MATRRRPVRPNPSGPAKPSVQSARRDPLPERLALGTALVLLVARPLFPSEDVDAGTGLVLVALWGFAAVLWATGQALSRKLLCYVSWIDLGPLVLFAAILVSAIRCDTPRPAINMACEWAGLMLCYWLVRQLFRSPTAQRFFFTAMLSVVVTLSAHGLYQVFWGLDSMRNEYATNRIAILRDLEITPGSPQEEAFKNRLNS